MLLALSHTHFFFNAGPNNFVPVKNKMTSCYSIMVKSSATTIQLFEFSSGFLGCSGHIST